MMCSLLCVVAVHGGILQRRRLPDEYVFGHDDRKQVLSYNPQDPAQHIPANEDQINARASNELPRFYTNPEFRPWRSRPTKKAVSFGLDALKTSTLKKRASMQRPRTPASSLAPSQQTPVSGPRDPTGGLLKGRLTPYQKCRLKDASSVSQGKGGAPMRGFVVAGGAQKHKGHVSPDSDDGEGARYMSSDQQTNSHTAPVAPGGHSGGPRARRRNEFKKKSSQFLEYHPRKLANELHEIPPLPAVLV